MESFTKEEFQELWKGWDFTWKLRSHPTVGLVSPGREYKTLRSETKEFITQGNSSRQSISFSEVNLQTSVPPGWHKESQVTSAQAMDCITEKKPRFSEHESLLMGNKHAMFLLQRQKPSLSSGTISKVVCYTNTCEKNSPGKASQRLPHQKCRKSRDPQRNDLHNYPQAPRHTMQRGSINEQFTLMRTCGSGLPGPSGRWCGTRFRFVPPEDTETGMFTLLFLSFVVQRLLSRELSPWHFLSAPCEGREQSLSWQVAGVCSRTLLAYKEVVSAPGMWCVIGAWEGGWERTTASSASSQTSGSGKIVLVYTLLN